MMISAITPPINVINTIKKNDLHIKQGENVGLGGIYSFDSNNLGVKFQGKLSHISK